MKSSFEFFVARRYLRAKRKQAVISVITVISVVGVAAGVMALVIAMAITTGMRTTLEHDLLSATPDIWILEKEPGPGIANADELIPRLKQVPHVTRASAALYGQVFFAGPVQSTGGFIKGLPHGQQQAGADILAHLQKGSAEDIYAEGEIPGIIVGAPLAEATGMQMKSIIRVISPQGTMTPFEPVPEFFKFRVVGVFQTGFYDLDSTTAFVSLKQAQRVLDVHNVVNSIELKLDDPETAPEVENAVDRIVGPKLAAVTWMEKNKALWSALRTEQLSAVIVIGLIELVAALNILITLMMMVMEKNRDIAVLMSMGAKPRQIRNIFIAQGVMIGLIGTGIGLVLGYGLSYLAGRYHWIQLNEAVYSLSYVPFAPQWIDGIWIALAAMFISLIATLYPARSATRIAPAEALRYE